LLFLRFHGKFCGISDGITGPKLCPAGAIQATVFGTSPAIFGKRLTKVFASPVQTHREIIAGQAKRGRNLGGVLAIEVDALKQVSILVWQRWQKSLETLANYIFVFRSGRLGKFAFEFFQCLFAGCIPAVEIDDGIPENPIEPRDGILRGRWLIWGSERFDETVLHQILRQMRIADSAADKGGELVQVG
jgi:hypothetical protein